MHLRTLILTALAGLLALPAAASADSVLAPSPGARALAAGGGYHAWLEPAPEAPWQLVVRGPGGKVTRPGITGLPRPSLLSIGSAGRVDPSDRQLSVVYARGGDLYRFDLARSREVKVGPISSDAYRETLGIAQYGAYVFVRRGGRRPGVYHYRPGRGSRRITSATPSLLASNGTRIAYVTGRKIVVRRISGKGAVMTFTSPLAIRSVTLTRYRVGWLTSGGRVFESARFGGSGRATTTVASQAARELPESTTSIATDGSRITAYTDPAGVKRIAPPLSPR